MTLEERWALRCIRPDGRVQLAAYPPAPQVVDVVVEPDAIVIAKTIAEAEIEKHEEWARVTAYQLTHGGKDPPPKS